MPTLLLYTPNDRHPPATIRDVHVINYHSPISILALELIQEIFAFSVWGDDDDDSDSPVPSFRTAALTLTWVCSQWRRIALSMPELWGIIDIHQPKKYCVDLVKIYLARSGDFSPLHLSFDQGVDAVLVELPFGFTQRVPSSPQQDATTEIMKLWIAQAHRWRSITLDMSYNTPLQGIRNIPPGALSSVQEAHLSLLSANKPNAEIAEWLWKNIFQSPSLRVAYWHNLDHGLIRPTTPFSQLTEFSLSTTDEKFLSILSSCTRLKRLIFSHPYPESDSDASPSSASASKLPKVNILLPFLQSLNLSLSSDPHILNHLTTPSLQKLHISDGSPSPFSVTTGPHTDILESFLVRSKCTLRILCLNNGRPAGRTPATDSSAATVPPMIQCISRLSKYLERLESLYVQSSPLSDEVVSLFIPQPQPQLEAANSNPDLGLDTTITSPSQSSGTVIIPFPSLIHLDLCMLITTDGVISSMAESRAAVGAPLRSLTCRGVRQVPTASPSPGSLDGPRDSLRSTEDGQDRASYGGHELGQTTARKDNIVFERLQQEGLKVYLTFRDVDSMLWRFRR